MRWSAGCTTNTSESEFSAHTTLQEHFSSICGVEGKMAKANLSRMGVEALMDLRRRVDTLLLEHRTDIQKQMERLDRAIAVLGGKRVASGGRRGSALRGRKVAPKYRSPSGETWAGRGARPLWLVAAIKSGKKKLDDFLIDKSGRKGRRKLKAKR
jgi:DNA-binding protein H-NS